MSLIIVESPTKAKTLSKFLKGSYDFLATKGHIKDLPKSKLGIDVEKDFKPDYVLVPSKAEVIAELEKEGKKAKEIYLATDPDREGEAISAHVMEILGKKKEIKRIVFHEITKQAVEEAIKNPRVVDKNLVSAQISRRVLDRLVGYKLSPLLWKKVRRGLSAGRVQSVVVRLIVEREREREAFKKDEYWEIDCLLQTKKKDSQDFTVHLTKINDKKVEVKNKKEADKLVADLKKSTYSVASVEKREVKKSPHPPFTTSTLAQTASSLFGWSARRTMSIAQRLYERGLITYHRTDSMNVSKVARVKLRLYIKKEYGDKYLSSIERVYKTKSKVVQEAHEAIRPTSIQKLIDPQKTKFKKETGNLYNLIRKRFLATQMAESVYDETKIDVLAIYQKEKFLLKTKGQILKFDGWKKIFKNNNNGKSILPEVEKDEDLDLAKVNSEQKFTQPPNRYTEAALIKKLEELGIGRPSTYAPVISTIQVRQYVEKDEGKFLPTPVGFAVNDFLIKNFPEVFDYSFTAQMEDELDEIANGNLKWDKSISVFYKPLEKKIKEVEKKAKRVKIEVEKTNRKCPECKKGTLVVRIGRFGKFLSCSEFPDCDYKEKYLQKIGMKCPECKKGDIIIQRTRKGRKFFGCSNYPKCKWASWRKPTKQTP